MDNSHQGSTSLMNLELNYCRRDGSMTFVNVEELWRRILGHADPDRCYS